MFQTISSIQKRTLRLAGPLQRVQPRAQLPKLHSGTACVSSPGKALQLIRQSSVSGVSECCMLRGGIPSPPSDGAIALCGWSHLRGMQRPSRIQPLVTSHYPPLETDILVRFKEAKRASRWERASALPWCLPALWMTEKLNACKLKNHLVTLLLVSLFLAIHCRGV